MNLIKQIIALSEAKDEKIDPELAKLSEQGEKIEAALKEYMKKKDGLDYDYGSGTFPAIYGTFTARDGKRLYMNAVDIGRTGSYKLEVSRNNGRKYFFEDEGLSVDEIISTMDKLLRQHADLY